MASALLFTIATLTNNSVGKTKLSCNRPTSFIPFRLVTLIAQFDLWLSLDSMVVYVIIGVVGFAAGAGGILWAVCMFIRR